RRLKFRRLAVKLAEHVKAREPDFRALARDVIATETVFMSSNARHELGLEYLWLHKMERGRKAPLAL
ncbi:MAG TPA: hypothetical protein VEQ16_05755, partial [Acidocella sp.]|nr:hypothetical protein [Acidocella sp.]